MCFVISATLASRHSVQFTLCGDRLEQDAACRYLVFLLDHDEPSTATSSTRDHKTPGEISTLFGVTSDVLTVFLSVLRHRTCGCESNHVYHSVRGTRIILSASPRVFTIPTLCVAEASGCLSVDSKSTGASSPVIEGGGSISVTTTI